MSGVRTMTRNAAVLALLLFAVLLDGCGSSPTSPSASPTFSQTDLRVGTGATAAAGNMLTVNYKGWLYDASRADQKGALFDSSYATGRTSFSVALGSGGVIKGWDQGLVGMRQGGLRRLVIPLSLGYGDTRSGPIPPNATLIFEIELLTVS
jgi:FKBP-type peptidyl-prolyl cis-trans isomerase FkpA